MHRAPAKLKKNDMWLFKSCIKENKNMENNSVSNELKNELELVNEKE